MWLPIVRDVAIVLLALESILIGLVLIAMLIQIRKLVRLLREEIAPMLYTANETLDTVKRTTDFVSENVVNPVIKASSYSTGVSQTLRSLFVVGRAVKKRKRVIVETPPLEDS